MTLVDALITASSHRVASHIHHPQSIFNQHFRVAFSDSLQLYPALTETSTAIRNLFSVRSASFQTRLIRFERSSTLPPSQTRYTFVRSYSNHAATAHFCSRARS